MTRFPIQTAVDEKSRVASAEHAVDSLLPPLQNDKIVLVVDLVESVRLMSLNEAGVVGEWHRFVQHALTSVLPRHKGRMVKSLGDGLLAEFDDARLAVQASLLLQNHFDAFNAGLAPEAQMHLRSGLHATHLYVDAQDIYGHGVNLAARVAGLGDPGDTVITAAVRDAIVDGVDGDLEDMGESFLKHWPEPVRTWRVSPAKPGAAPWRHERPEAPTSDFRPSIAVIPFEARSASPDHFVIGELIADGVIAQLARSHGIRVISRMSTTAFRGRQSTPSEIDARLDAPFVLSGGYVVMDKQVLITAELADTRCGEVVWAERLSGDTMDLMQVESELINTLTTACAHAMLNAEVQRSFVLPLPQLDSNALMLGGITLMHRSTPRDLQRSQQLLEAVAERHNRVAAPRAWLAKWHIMQVVQGLSDNPGKTFQRAIDDANRALDLEPNSSLALAVKGHALCHQGVDVEASLQSILESTRCNPNDPMAWLYLGFWSAMWGDPDAAIAQAKTAIHLSPIDPLSFYFQMQLANCYLAKDMLAEAVETGLSSYRTNSLHLSTLRSLITAEYELGRMDEAKGHLKILRQHQPSLTIDQFLSYGRASKGRQRVAAAFEALGLPQA
jgi:adenylate cyclase